MGRCHDGADDPLFPMIVGQTSRLQWTYDGRGAGHFRADAPLGRRSGLLASRPFTPPPTPPWSASAHRPQRSAPLRDSARLNWAYPQIVCLPTRWVEVQAAEFGVPVEWVDHPPRPELGRRPRPPPAPPWSASAHRPRRSANPELAAYEQAILKSGIFQSPTSVSARSSRVSVPPIRQHLSYTTISSSRRPIASPIDDGGCYSRASGPSSATRRGLTRAFNTGPVTSHAAPTRPPQAPEHLIRRNTSPTVRLPP